MSTEGNAGIVDDAFVHGGGDDTGPVLIQCALHSDAQSFQHIVAVGHL